MKPENRIYKALRVLWSITVCSLVVVFLAVMSREIYRVMSQPVREDWCWDLCAEHGGHKWDGWGKTGRIYELCACKDGYMESRGGVPHREYVERMKSYATRNELDP